MKNLVFILLFPAFLFAQEDIERYKVYDTDNIYTSIF